MVVDYLTNIGIKIVYLILIMYRDTCLLLPRSCPYRVSNPQWVSSPCCTQYSWLVLLDSLKQSSTTATTTNNMPADILAKGNLSSNPRDDRYLPQLAAGC